MYDVSVKQIPQNVLPPTPVAGLPNCPATFTTTNVFAYGPNNIVGTPFHNWPGFTVEAHVSGLWASFVTGMCVRMLAELQRYV